MNSTVFKYRTQLADYVVLELPEGAIFRHAAGPKDPHAADQHGVLSFWFEVDPDADAERRLFRIAGTGHLIPNIDQLNFLTTVLMYGGELVWHIYEVDMAKVEETDNLALAYDIASKGRERHLDSAVTSAYAGDTDAPADPS